MKKILFFFYFLTNMVYCTFSQYILPQPIQNPVWTYIEATISMGLNEFRVYQISYNGDTLIGDKKYDVLVETNSNQIDKIYGYVRQDTVTQSVYIIRKYLDNPFSTQENEQLLYKGGGQVGNTSNFSGMYSEHIFSDSLYYLDSIVDYTSYDGILRKMYCYHAVNGGEPLQFIEDIGFITPAFGPTPTNYKQNVYLMCLKLNDIKAFYKSFEVNSKNIDCDDLGYYLSSGIDNKIPDLGISVFPNPSTTGLVNISYLQKDNSHKLIQIYNINGVLLKEFIYYSDKFTLDFSDFSNGLYFIVLFDENAKNYSEKVIIQK